MYNHLGTAWMKGDYILLFERKGRAHKQAKKGPASLQEGRCQATWKREFKLLWREAGPPNHHDDKVDSDQ